MNDEIMSHEEREPKPKTIIDNKKSSFAIIGLGMFGSTMAKILAAEGVEVLAIDRSERLIQEISDYVSSAIAFDATDETLMRAHGIANIDVAIVSIGEDFGSTVIITQILKDIQKEEDSRLSRVYSRAASEREEKILVAIGADHIYRPEKTQAESEARILTLNNVHSFVTLVGDICVVETGVKKGMVGQELREMDFRKTYTLNIAYIGRMKDGKIKYRLPRPDDTFKEDDQIFVIGDEGKIEEYINAE